jgi:hypothetical protein
VKEYYEEKLWHVSIMKNYDKKKKKKHFEANIAERLLFRFEKFRINVLCNTLYAKVKNKATNIFRL